MKKTLTVSRVREGQIWWVDESGYQPQIIASSHPIANDLTISPEDVQWCIDTGARQVEVEMEGYGHYGGPFGTDCLYKPVVRGGYIVRSKSIREKIEEHDEQEEDDLATAVALYREAHPEPEPKTVRQIAEEEWEKQDSEIYAVPAKKAWIVAYYSAYANLQQLIQAKK